MACGFRSLGGFVAEPWRRCPWFPDPLRGDADFHDARGHHLYVLRRERSQLYGLGGASPISIPGGQELWLEQVGLTIHASAGREAVELRCAEGYFEMESESFRLRGEVRGRIGAEQVFYAGSGWPMTRRRTFSTRMRLSRWKMADRFIKVAAFATGLRMGFSNWSPAYRSSNSDVLSQTRPLFLFSMALGWFTVFLWLVWASTAGAMTRVTG